MKYFKNIIWLLPLILLFVAGCSGKGGVFYEGPKDDTNLEEQGPTKPPATIENEPSESELSGTSARLGPSSAAGFFPGSSISLPEKKWKQVSLGGQHSCGIYGDNTLWCWGWNYNGQIGDETNEQRNRPVQIKTPDVNKFLSVSAGGSHTCAISENEKLYCWGSNRFGQLGLGEAGNPDKNIPTPVSVPDTDQWMSIAAGGLHTCGIKKSNQIFCWGSNNAGQLGIGELGNPDKSVPTPVSVSSGDQWMSVAAGESHTCGVKLPVSGREPVGELWCWGLNYDGQLGIGKRMGNNKNIPTKVGDFSSSSVSAGGNYSCAIDTYQTLYCWGMNISGQLGNGSHEPIDTPRTSINMIVSAISAGGSHTCELKIDGAFCWGDNTYGQLGVGRPFGHNQPTRVTVDGLVAIDAGYAHTCGIRDNGALLCWGWNEFGQLGRGTTSGGYDPLEVEK